MIKLLTLSIISFLSSLLLGKIIIPVFKKMHNTQNTSRFLERHANKNGTPTMGGIIFLIPLFLVMIFFILNRPKYSIILLLFSTFSYFILGFYDDFLKVKKHNNAGLSIKYKFLIQLFIALIFFFFYTIFGFSTKVCFFNYCIDIKFIYGILILLILVGTTNAVNITDGLDGLCSGLMIISLTTYAIITQNISLSLIICSLIASLMAFLVFNKHPAKIFMGDLGSLALGAFLGTIAIVTKNEFILIIIALVFIIEIVSSFIQVIFLKYFHHPVFLKAPLHHHFEEMGFNEKQIVLLFYLASIFFNIIAILLRLSV